MNIFKSLLGGVAKGTAGFVGGAMGGKGRTGDNINLSSQNVATPPEPISRNPIVSNSDKDASKDIRAPILDTGTFQHEKIKGGNITKALDQIHSNIIGYLNTVNRNTVATFNYIKDVTKKQDARINNLSRDIEKLTRSQNQIENKMTRINARIANLEARGHKRDWSPNAMDNRNPMGIGGGDNPNPMGISPVTAGMFGAGAGLGLAGMARFLPRLGAAGLLGYGAYQMWNDPQWSNKEASKFWGSGGFGSKGLDMLGSWSPGSIRKGMGLRDGEIMFGPSHLGRMFGMDKKQHGATGSWDDNDKTANDAKAVMDSYVLKRQDITLESSTNLTLKAQHDLSLSGRKIDLKGDILNLSGRVITINGKNILQPQTGDASKPSGNVADSPVPMSLGDIQKSINNFQPGGPSARQPSPNGRGPHPNQTPSSFLDRFFGGSKGATGSWSNPTFGTGGGGGGIAPGLNQQAFTPAASGQTPGGTPDMSGKVMLIMSGLNNAMDSMKNTPEGRQAAEMFAKSKGMIAKFIDAPGGTGANSPQVQQALQWAMNNKDKLGGVMGFSRGGYNVRHLLNQLPDDVKGQLQNVTALGAPNMSPDSIKGPWQTQFDPQHNGVIAKLAQNQAEGPRITPVGPFAAARPQLNNTPSGNGSLADAWKRGPGGTLSEHNTQGLIKSGVDPRIIDTLRGGAQYLPEGYQVRIEGGIGTRGGRPTKHAIGKAVDLQIWGPDGKPIGAERTKSNSILANAYQNPETFRMYEVLAQGAYKTGLEKYPDVPFTHGGRFRNNWQGGDSFNGNYGAIDTMHYSIGEGMGARGPDGKPKQVLNNVNEAAPEIVQNWLRRHGFEESRGMGDDPRNWMPPEYSPGAMEALRRVQPQTPFASQGPVPGAFGESYIAVAKRQKAVGQTQTNFTEASQVLAEQRRSYAEQIRQNPVLQRDMAAIMLSEQGYQTPEGIAGRKAVFETMLNRGKTQDITDANRLLGARNPKDGYYAPFWDGAYHRNLERLKNDPALLNQIVGEQEEVFRGSNYSNLGTHNASLGVAASAKRTQTITASFNEEIYSRKDREEFAKQHGLGTVRRERKWFEETKAAMDAAEQNKSKDKAPGTQSQLVEKGANYTFKDTGHVYDAGILGKHALDDYYAGRKGIPPYGQNRTVDELRQAVRMTGDKNLEKKFNDEIEPRIRSGQPIGLAEVATILKPTPEQWEKMKAKFPGVTRTPIYEQPAQQPAVPNMAQTPEQKRSMSSFATPEGRRTWNEMPGYQAMPSMAEMPKAQTAPVGGSNFMERAGVKGFGRNEIGSGLLDAARLLPFAGAGVDIAKGLKGWLGNKPSPVAPSTDANVAALRAKSAEQTMQNITQNNIGAKAGVDAKTPELPVEDFSKIPDSSVDAQPFKPSTDANVAALRAKSSEQAINNAIALDEITVNSPTPVQPDIPLSDGPSPPDATPVEPAAPATGKSITAEAPVDATATASASAVEDVPTRSANEAQDATPVEPASSAPSDDFNADSVNEDSFTGWDSKPEGQGGKGGGDQPQRQNRGDRSGGSFPEAGGGLRPPVHNPESEAPKPGDNGYGTGRRDPDGLGLCTI